MTPEDLARRKRELRKARRDVLLIRREIYVFLSPLLRIVARILGDR